MVSRASAVRLPCRGVDLLTGWQVYPLPMDDLSNLDFSGMDPSKETVGPAFYQGHFNLQDVGDTFLDTRGWGKSARENLCSPEDEPHARL